MSEIAGLNQTHMTTLAAFGNNMKQPSYVYGTNNWANHKKIIIHYNYNLKQDKLWLYWDSYPLLDSSEVTTWGQVFFFTQPIMNQQQSHY